MPPKKKVQTSTGEDDSVILTSIDDFNLPKSMIQRLAKGVLPANTQIQKDALTALLKSTTVFVSYLASNANDRAILGNHKTIKPQDVMDALRELEFENFVPRVKAEHDRFVEIQNNKRNDYRRRLKVDGQPETKEEADGPDGQQDDDDSTLGNSSSLTSNLDENARTGIPTSGGERRRADAPPVAKKPRISLTNGSSGTKDHENVDDDATEEDDEDVDVDATEPEEEEDGIDDDMDDTDVEENIDEYDSGEDPVEGLDLDHQNRHQLDVNENSDEDDDE